jgi:ABC-type lipoprotein export system ATPase subunit
MSDHSPKKLKTIEEPMISMQGVIKTFINAAGHFTVLKGLDLTLNRGEFVSIIGKSGSGKSTMLNMITGIDHPTSGRVIVNGTDLYAMNESQRALWRGKNLGIVFQFFQLLPTLSLLENVMLPMDLVQVYQVDDRPVRAMDLLRMVGLADYAHKLPAAVSSGQQQSAAIARALATDPPLIVADEPTGNLDSNSAADIISLFVDLVRSGKTIVMVTHDPSLTERTSRTIVIADGELVDETVARALPLLNHSQMLDVSREVLHLSINPSDTIIHDGQHVENFYMISSGKVEVVLKKKRSGEVILARLSDGDFFGEVELMMGGQAIACVRASSDSPVNLAAIPADLFRKHLYDSPLTEESLGKVVQHRIKENRMADRRRLPRLERKP